MLVVVPTAFEAELLFGAGWERRPVALCGFGLAAAGAAASHAIGEHLRAGGEPRVLLAGLAGTYNPVRAPVGSVVAASAVRCHGIGVGEGAEHIGAAALGWSHVPADLLELSPPAGIPAGEILSVTAGSRTRREAAARAGRYPQALAEEMEGFAVALAATLHGVELTLVRGISNVAGVRDKATWRAAEALAAVREAIEP